MLRWPASPNANGSSFPAIAWTRSWCSRGEKGSVRSGAQSWAQAAHPELDRYDRFVVFDASTDTSVAVDATDIRRARDTCAKLFAQSEAAPPTRKTSTTRLFVSGAKDLVLFGLLTDHSADIIEIKRSADAATAACLGTLFYTGEVATWRAAQDGTTLLAGGSKLGLSWSVAEAMIDKASALIAKGGLREAACREGLRGREDDELVTNTYLGVQPVKLCEAPAAKPSRKLRAAPGFPGVNVLKDPDQLTSSFSKGDAREKAAR